MKNLNMKNLIDEIKVAQKKSKIKLEQKYGDGWKEVHEQLSEDYKNWWYWVELENYYLALPVDKIMYLAKINSPERVKGNKFIEMPKVVKIQCSECTNMVSVYESSIKANDDFPLLCGDCFESGDFK